MTERSYWRLEWLGWEFYRRHLIGVTVSTWKADLRPLRALLSIPSFLVALFLLMPDVAYDFPGFGLISDWIPENVLASAFALHGFGMLWRMYAPSRQPVWTCFFGALGIALYVGFPLGVFFDLQRVTVLGISMFGWAFACFWIVARVGDGEDRSGP